MAQPGFFDLDERYRRLSETGDPLVKLTVLIDFEVFRPRLLAVLKRSDDSKGGRPPYELAFGEGRSGFHAACAADAALFQFQ